MVLAQPEERVREQEVLHLGPTEVEDERSPVGMRTAPRVGVLVQRGAVEARQRPLVAREMGRHPVEQHADPVRVQVVDEVAEVVGRAERRERRVVAGHLIAPRARVRVVHDGQQLDVGEAEVAHVRRQLIRELAPPEALPPGRRVHLVDRHRPFERLLLAPRRRSSPRPATCAPTGRRPTRSSAGPRPRTRAGRPSRARPGGTCSAARSPRPATMPSQIPVSSTGLSRSAAGSQSLKSPTTLTYAALGAQTAKRTPPSTAMRSELRVELLVASGPRQPDVELTERRPRLGPRHTGTSSASMRSIPATGIPTQSGRLFSS